MAGASIRTQESIGKLVKLTAATLQLPASRVNVGPLQYVSAALTLNTGTSGFGGIDTGAIAASSGPYYIYAVVSGGNLGLVCSLSSTGPTGFSQYRMVGFFFTDAASAIWGLANRSISLTSWSKATKWTSILSAVTSSVAFTGTNAPNPLYARARFWTDSNFVWHMDVEIGGTVASGSRTGTTLTINNVAMNTTLGNPYNSLLGLASVSPDISAFVEVGSGTTLLVSHATATTVGYSVNGSVLLTAEPTTYTLAANMELINTL